MSSLAREAGRTSSTEKVLVQVSVEEAFKGRRTAGEHTPPRASGLVPLGEVYPAVSSPDGWLRVRAQSLKS